MRAKLVYEKFTEDSDPIKDLGIGIYSIKNFQNQDDLLNWVIEVIPFILRTNKIPKDILKDKYKWLNPLYGDLIYAYMEEYLRFNNRKLNVNMDRQSWPENLHRKLHAKGFKV